VRKEIADILPSEVDQTPDFRQAAITEFENEQSRECSTRLPVRALVSTKKS